MEFIRRNISDLLISRLKHEQVIVVTGARQTGKTTLCERLLPEYLNIPFTYISFDDPDERLRFQNAAISVLESIDTPLVILDEVQKIPSLFDPLKYVVDKRGRERGGDKKFFILTGSSQLTLLKTIKETLAGRVALLNLYPFSLSEVIGGEGNLIFDKIWHEKKITKDDIRQFHALSPERIREEIHRRDEHQMWGGYPPVWQREERTGKISWLKDYRRTYIERDILDVGQVGNIDTFVLVQKLLCARTAKLLSFSEVAREVALSVNTVKRYLHLLSATFQCHLLPPYFENIGKRFIKSPKIYFPDAGLNRVILGERSIDIGATYETWVFSELIKWKQLQPIEPEIFYYRTSGGMEIDFILCAEEIFLPIEVKASGKVSYADARNLESFLNEHKKAAPFGLVIYPGRALEEIRKNIWAVPDWFLFGTKA